MIRIIRGKKKNTKLNVPKLGVRPTSSMKKESIFSILESFSFKNNLELYNKKYFLDLFSGSGSLGLEAISRGAYTILISDKKSVKKAKLINFSIVIPDFDKQFNTFFSPILMAIPAQLLAYHVARVRGTDVDQPRNLAKSVTVE